MTKSNINKTFTINPLTTLNLSSESDTTTSSEVIFTTIENKMQEEEKISTLPLPSPSQASSSLSSTSLSTTTTISTPTIKSTTPSSSQNTLPGTTESIPVESSALPLYPFQTGDMLSAQMVEEGR